MNGGLTVARRASDNGTGINCLPSEARRENPSIRFLLSVIERGW
jgi:hypothetical protein